MGLSKVLYQVPMKKSNNKTSDNSLQSSIYITNNPNDSYEYSSYNRPNAILNKIINNLNILYSS